MANSSFDYFRKHSKVAVVALGLLCILAFVVADPLLQWLQASQGGAVQSDRSDVAVSWDGGQLTEGELGGLVARRQILAAFLTRVEQMGAYEAMAAGAPANLPSRVQPLRLPTKYEEGVETDVVQSQVFARAARDAGMVISDQTIVDYLTGLGRDRVSRDAMREIISGISLGRGRATPEFVFGLLRDALLAQSYFTSHVYAQATITPQQRWEDWRKVNDRVVVEVAQLNADDFVSQVEDPSDSELQEFFDEYKNAIPSPALVDNRQLPSPTPGFRKPARAKLQYARTDYAQALEEAREQVTEEEIAEYYEENKAMFIRTGGPRASEDEIEAADDELEVADDPADEASDAEGESGEESDAPANEDQDAQTDEQASPEQSGGVARKNPFRLASYQPEEGEEASSDEQAAEEPAPEADESNPLEEFMTPSEDEESASDEETEGESAAEDSDATAEAPQVEYQTLDEVSDEIREILAKRKAVENQQQRANDLLAVLKNDYNGYFTQRIDAEAAKQEAPEPPAALTDFKKLAEENGLEYGETELLSAFEMAELEEPRLMYYLQEAGRAIRIATQVFRKGGLELYEPDVAYDSEPNFYLIMKIEEQKEEEPKLEDLREEVLAAWKHEKASELALAKAEEMAKQASDSGRALKDQFGEQQGVEIKESDMFGWLQPVAASSTGAYALRLDDPGAIEGAGPDFMKAVFALGPNEVGAALSHGHNHAYAVRVVQREKSSSELREAFLRDWRFWPGVYSTQRAHVGDVARAILKDLLGGEDLDWKREANVSPVEREASEEA